MAKISAYSTPSEYIYQPTYTPFPVEQVAPIAMKMQQEYNAIDKATNDWATAEASRAVGGSADSSVRDAYYMAIKGNLNAMKDEYPDLRGVEFNSAFNNLVQSAAPMSSMLKDMEKTKANHEAIKAKITPMTPDAVKHGIQVQEGIWDTQGTNEFKKFNKDFFGVADNSFIDPDALKDAKPIFDFLHERTKDWKEQSGVGGLTTEISAEEMAPFLGLRMVGNDAKFVGIPNIFKDSPSYNLLKLEAMHDVDQRILNGIPGYENMEFGSEEWFKEVDKNINERYYRDAVNVLVSDTKTDINVGMLNYQKGVTESVSEDLVNIDPIRDLFNADVTTLGAKDVIYLIDADPAGAKPEEGVDATLNFTNKKYVVDFANLNDAKLKDLTFLVEFEKNNAAISKAELEGVYNRDEAVASNDPYKNTSYGKFIDAYLGNDPETGKPYAPHYQTPGQTLGMSGEEKQNMDLDKYSKETYNHIYNIAKAVGITDGSTPLPITVDSTPIEMMDYYDNVLAPAAKEMATTQAELNKKYQDELKLSEEDMKDYVDGFKLFSNTLANLHGTFGIAIPRKDNKTSTVDGTYFNYELVLTEDNMKKIFEQAYEKQNAKGRRVLKAFEKIGLVTETGNVTKDNIKNKQKNLLRLQLHDLTTIPDTRIIEYNRDKTGYSKYNQDQAAYTRTNITDLRSKGLQSRY